MDDRTQPLPGPWGGKSDLNYVENPVVNVDGAATPAEYASAIVAGVNAPLRLSFDPAHPDYDPHWCRMVRDVRVNGQPVDLVIGFNIPAHVVYQLVTRAGTAALPEFDEMTDASGQRRLVYRRREVEGQVTVAYGLPVDGPAEDRRHGGR